MMKHSLGATLLLVALSGCGGKPNPVESAATAAPRHRRALLISRRRYLRIR